jgi:hypothetical protein
MTEGLRALLLRKPRKLAAVGWFARSTTPTAMVAQN